MALELTENIDDEQRFITVTGDVPEDIEPGYGFRIGDEPFRLQGFVVPQHKLTEADRNRWYVVRGANGTAAGHTAGDAILGAVDALVASASGTTPPNPFASDDGGGGSDAITDPTDIADCALWLDASTLALADNDPVATWPDGSGNGYDATQAEGDNQPTYDTTTIPAIPFVNFDPSVNNQWLAFSGDALGMFSEVSAVTFAFMLVNRDGASPQALFGAMLAGGTFPRVAIQARGGSAYGIEAYVYNDDASISYVLAEGGAYPEGAAGNWAAASGIVASDLTTGWSSGWEGGYRASLPNDLGGSGSAALNALAALGPTTSTLCEAVLLSGDGGVAFNPWEGGVAELIVYTRALNARERRQLLEYLSAKWGTA